MAEIGEARMSNPMASLSGLILVYDKGRKCIRAYYDPVQFIVIPNFKTNKNASPIRRKDSAFGANRAFLSFWS